MIKRSLLTIVLIASAGAVHAQGEPMDPYGRPLLGRNDWVRQPGDQPGPAVSSGGRTTVMTTSPAGSIAAMPPPSAPVAATTSTNAVAGEPVDPYGRPLIGRNDWVRQPGDQPGSQGAGVSTGASPQIGSGPRQAVFKDEFGFRYDAQGNRLDARGNVISPQTR